MEVLAIVRAHITALGGNAMVAFFMTQCVLLHSPHKNQVSRNIYFILYSVYSSSLHLFSFAFTKEEKFSFNLLSVLNYMHIV